VISERSHWRTDLLNAVIVYALSVLPVLAGLAHATRIVAPSSAALAPVTLNLCCYFDGGHFNHIVREGYRSEDPEQPAVAFFPGYPLIVRFLVCVTDWPVPYTLVMTANASFLAALVLLSAYLRLRMPGDSKTRFTTLLLVGFFPFGFFFRMGYSESLFFALIVLLLLGVAKKWPLWVLAVIAGAATGVRAVGIATSFAGLVHVLADRERGSPIRRLTTAGAIAPLAVWGLLAFMAYQWLEFGTPLGFVEAHSHWIHYRPSPGDLGPKWVRLLLAEPIWNAYRPCSPRYWMSIDQCGVPFLGLAFWNPMVFVSGVIAVCLGWHRKWLTPTEGVLGLGLLLIPYVSRADEMSMVSQSRFATVVVPGYVVFGRLLARTPALARLSTFAIMAVLLGVWTSLFARTWPLF